MRHDANAHDFFPLLSYPGALEAVSASSSSLDTGLSHKAKSTVSVRHILIVFRKHLVSLVVVATSRVSSSYSRPPCSPRVYRQLQGQLGQFSQSLIAQNYQNLWCVTKVSTNATISSSLLLKVVLLVRPPPAWANFTSSIRLY